MVVTMKNAVFKKYNKVHSVIYGIRQHTWINSAHWKCYVSTPCGIWSSHSCEWWVVSDEWWVARSQYWWDVAPCCLVDTYCDMSVEYWNDGMVVPKELGKGYFCGNGSLQWWMRGLVADRHSRGNEPTIATQRVTIGISLRSTRGHFRPDPKALGKSDAEE
jgi:hypothetical protein